MAIILAIVLLACRHDALGRYEESASGAAVSGDEGVGRRTVEWRESGGTGRDSGIRLAYDPGLMLIAGEQQYRISGDLFAGVSFAGKQAPRPELRVIGQAYSDAQVIVVSVMWPDETFGSRAQLWAFEYDGARLRNMWDSGGEPVSVPYEIAEYGTGRFGLQLSGPRLAEPYALESKPDADRGQMALSAPVDFLLADATGDEREEIIVRRKIVGEKPAWLPFDAIATVFYANKGFVEPHERYIPEAGPLVTQRDLTPKLAYELQPYDGGEPVVVRLTADSDIDRQSLEQSIRRSLASSDPTRSDYRVEFDWRSGRAVDARFYELREHETIRFAFDTAANRFGKPFYRPGEHYDHPHVALEKAAQREPELVVTDVLDAAKRSSIAHPVPLAARIDKVHVAGTANDYVLLYGDNAAQLLDPATGNKLPLPTSRRSHSPYANLLHYRDDLFAPQFGDTYAYVAQGHASVDRINWKTGASTRIWTAPGGHPVYGIGASPDGSRVAVVYSSDAHAGASFDLAVLDRQGKLLLEKPQFGYASKSDGILASIAVEWPDNDTVAVQTEIQREGLPSQWGTRSVDIGGGAVADRVAAAEEQADLLRIAEKEKLKETGALHAIPSPDRKRTAYMIVSEKIKEIWLYDSRDGSFVLIGSGTLLGWLDDNRLLSHKSYRNEPMLP